MYLQQENRKDPRVRFDSPQKLELHIRRVHGQIVKIKKVVLAFAMDISTSGLRIESQLDLPTGRMVVYRAPLIIDGKFFSIEGVIVRKRKTEEGYEYGMEFDFENLEDYRSLKTQVNILSIRRSHRIANERN